MPETFDEKVQARSLEFAQRLLAEVPELECVAVVPSYKVQQLQLPAGYVLTRNGQPSTPKELANISQQLISAWRHLTSVAFDVVRHIDTLAGEAVAKFEKTQDASHDQH